MLSEILGSAVPQLHASLKIQDSKAEGGHVQSFELPRAHRLGLRIWGLTLLCTSAGDRGDRDSDCSTYQKAMYELRISILGPAFNSLNILEGLSVGIFALSHVF